MTILEQLKQIDRKQFENEGDYYGLATLYEAVRLSPEDKEEIRKVLQATNDAEAVAAVLQTKAAATNEDLAEDVDDDVIDCEDDFMDADTLDEAYDTDVVAEILSGNIMQPKRGFKYLSSNGDSGEVLFNGGRYAFRRRGDGTFRVMRASSAGNNWSETLFAEDVDNPMQKKEVFHNDNGIDYDIIERSKSGTNALLQRGNQWIIAWNCPENNQGSWGQGHYFFDEKTARKAWEDKYLNESLDESYTLEKLHQKLWNMDAGEKVSFPNGYTIKCAFYDRQGMAKKFSLYDRNDNFIDSGGPGFAWQPQIQRFENEIINLLNTGKLPNKNESLNEDKVIYSLRELRDWIKDHKQATKDIERYYGKPVDNLFKDEIFDWLFDHEEMFNDFKRYFGVDESLNEARSLAKPFKKDLKNTYKSFDRQRDYIRKKNAAMDAKIDHNRNELDMDISDDAVQEIKDFMHEREPKWDTYKSNVEHRMQGLESDTYPFYVTYYVEVPYYHPEEGGYYVAGVQAEQSTGYNTRQEARQAAAEYADEMGFEKLSADDYRLYSKYIGDSEYICVEPANKYLSREEGDHVYESLKEDWVHFSFKSGANPYIAKSQKEANRVIKKYGKHKVKKLKDGFYEIDDEDDYSFWENESLKEEKMTAYGHTEKDINRLKYRLRDIAKEIERGADPERLAYEKNRIQNELIELGCNDGWYDESLNESKWVYSVKPRKLDTDVYDIVNVESGKKAHSKIFDNEDACKSFIKRNARYYNWLGAEKSELVNKQDKLTDYGKVLYNNKDSNESLDEDTIKQNGKWVNKGKEGTHGKFATKKAADAQRKAMFANGYKESMSEGLQDIHNDFEAARRQWNSYGFDVSLDDALEMYNEVYGDEDENFYAKPIYDHQAWTTMVRLVSGRTDTDVLEYDDDAYDRWGGLFDVPGPQEVANDMGRKVRHKDKIYTPQRNESLLETDKALTLNEDGYKSVIADLESIEKFLRDNDFYNYDVADYDVYPMGTSKIDFEISGDWKHDHLNFKFLIDEWADKNNRKILKIDSEEIGDSDSDDYTAIHHVYITKDDETYDKLNSMRGLFSESLDANDKQIYINEIKEAEDIEDLEDIVHEIYSYDKGLFVQLRHFPKDKSFEEIRDHMIEVIQGTLKEDYQHQDDTWGTPYTYDEVEADLQQITNNWTDKDGLVRCYWEQEKEYGKQILQQHYKVVEVSDGRTGKGENMSWAISYAEPKQELA